MSNWSDRWRAIRHGVLELHAWLALFGAIGFVFAAAVAAVSWLTESITFLAQFGWGLPVLAAMGIVLVIIIGLSLAAMVAAKAWRAYRPLTTVSVKSRALPTIADVVDAGVESERKIAELKKKIDELASKTDVEAVGRKLEVLNLSLPPLEHQGQDLAARLDSQRQIIDAIGDQLQGAQTGIQNLVERVAYNEGVVARGTHLLIRALRARDAMREILIPNDKIVMSLGKPLLEAKAANYPDPASWLVDYERWSKALRAIDHLLIGSTEGLAPPVASLFDLEARHFQHSPMPPENIKADNTIIPFKTVWHVQSSYINRRDGIFSSFDEKAAYPS